MIKLVKIDKIESFNYEGDVYNLELKTNDPTPDHDDLYWIDATTGIITHNCFPKDLNAMINFGSENEGNTSFLEAVRNYNDSVRLIRDWEGMKGRAVSDD